MGEKFIFLKKSKFNWRHLQVTYPIQMFRPDQIKKSDTLNFFFRLIIRSGLVRHLMSDWTMIESSKGPPADPIGDLVIPRDLWLSLSLSVSLRFSYNFFVPCPTYRKFPLTTFSLTCRRWANRIWRLLQMISRKILLTTINLSLNKFISKSRPRQF